MEKNITYKELYSQGFEYEIKLHNDMIVFTNGIERLIVREQLKYLELLYRMKGDYSKIKYIQTRIPFDEDVNKYIKNLYY